MSVPYLEPSFIRRDGRCLVVRRETTGTELRLEDCTGDVDLILGLVQEGRLTRQGVIARMIGRRDGVTATAVNAVLDRLQTLGLVGTRSDGTVHPERSIASDGRRSTAEHEPA